MSGFKVHFPIKKVKENEYRYYNFSSLTLILFTGLIISIPVLKTPLGTDDIWMSTLRAHNEFNNISLADYLIFKSIEFHNIGRLSQLTNFLQWATSYFIDQRLIYKMFLIALNIAVGLFVRRMLQKNFPQLGAYYGNVAFFIFVSLGQLRNYYDPRASIAGVCLFSSITMILCINFVINFLSRSRVLDLNLFTLFAVLSFYIYEMTFFILAPIFLFVFILFFSSRKHEQFRWIKFQKMTSFVLISTQYAIFLWTHYSSQSLQDDSTINFSWDDAQRTFRRQFWGSFPAKTFGSQKVYEPQMVSDKLQLLILIISVTAAICLFLFFLKFISSKSNRSYSFDMKQNPVYLILIFAISMMLIPAALTALTLRFQRDIQVGLPYASFYYFQVGFSILVVFLLLLLKSRLQEAVFTIILLLCIIYSAFVSTIVNYTITNPNFPLNDNASISQPVLGWEREVIEDFARLGFFDSGLSKKSYFFYPQFAWTTQEYLTYLSGKNVSVIGSPKWWNNTSLLPNLDCRSDKTCGEDLFVRAKGFDYDSGVLKVAFLRDLEVNDKKISSLNWKLIFINKDSVMSRLNQCKYSLGQKGVSLQSLDNQGNFEKFSEFQIRSSVPIHLDELDLCLS
jgi:hypothetical protein